MPRRDPSQSISPSQLDAMDCRLKWYWTYKQGYRPIERNRNLALGTGIHLGLEAYYGHKTDPVAAFQAWADREIAQVPTGWPDELAKMYEIRQLGSAMLEGYVKHWRGRDNFDVIATEHTITRPLPDPTTNGEQDSPYHVTVRLDGVIRDHHTGRLMSLEHKTYSRIDPSHFPRDHQFTLQVWCGQFLAESLGLDEEVIGVLYNGLRSQMPGPRVSSPLFERHFIERNQRQIDVQLHRAYWSKVEFDRPGLEIYPEPQMIKCGRCDVSEVCESYMKGEDYRQILDTKYVKRGSSSQAVAAERQQVEEVITTVQENGHVAAEPEPARVSLKDRMRG
jgi:hypothetical protein